MKILVRYYRDSIGISQQELAEIVGLTRIQISNIERGKHFPSIITAQKIAKILKTTTDKLWPPEEDETK